MTKRRVGLALLAAPLVWAAVRLPFGPADCAGERAAVVVDTSRHAMSLCEDGRAVRWFSVRLGWAGVGKTREGDQRTPLGRYALADAVPSASYGSFALIGYPTPEQRRAGLTGSAVGVHGPGRRARYALWLVNLVDATDGCVGLATDDDMRIFADWKRRHPGAEIVIR